MQVFTPLNGGEANSTLLIWVLPLIARMSTVEWPTSSHADRRRELPRDARQGTDRRCERHLYGVVPSAWSR